MADSLLTEQCTICSALVRVGSVQAHIDWHTALQVELDSKEAKPAPHT